MSGQRIIVCGGRDYADRDRVFAVLDALHAADPIAALGCGLAPGADALAVEWAKARSVRGLGFRAMWDRDGKVAGPLRNQRMLKKMAPALVVAFPGGRGTADMTRRAKAAGVRVMNVA